MAASTSRLLELDDELLVQHIYPKVGSLYHVANACKRLCKLARCVVEVIRCDEEAGAAVEHWPADYTFAGCRGLEYYTADGGMLAEVGGAENAAQLVLPLLTALLPHACAYWTRLCELALVLQPGHAGQRHANTYVTQQLPQLTALRSLRHLQFYKTAPLLVEDMQHLAQLTQLTSLLLADQSYMPGLEAMVPVEVSPLSGLTRLQSLGVAGICPQLPAAILPLISAGRLADWDSTMTATLVEVMAGGAGPCCSSPVADLPVSLTSLVIKRADDIALNIWSYHMLPLTSLRDLQVLEYLEPQATPGFEAFPSPLLVRIAPQLTGLTTLAFSMSNVDNMRTWRGYQCTAAMLPRASGITRLRHLQMLDLTWCQIGVQTPNDWQALSSLTQLTCLYGIDTLCVPPADVQLPVVQRLGIETARCWGVADVVWHLTATFPKLDDLFLGLDSSEQWLGVQPVLAEVLGMQHIGLEFRFCINEACAAALERLGTQLPALRALHLGYSGGPDGWRLPRMQSYTRLQELTLQLMVPGAAVLEEEHEPLDVNDTVLLAHLWPLQGLTQLMLCRMPGITAGVVLGLCAALTKLEQLHFLHCIEINEDDDERASWEGSELQLARAALKDAAVRDGRIACEVSVFSHFNAAFRAWRVLPCQVSYVRAYQHQF